MCVCVCVCEREREAEVTMTYQVKFAGNSMLFQRTFYSRPTLLQIFLWYKCSIINIQHTHASIILDSQETSIDFNKKYKSILIKGRLKCKHDQVSIL